MEFIQSIMGGQESEVETGDREGNNVEDVSRTIAKTDEFGRSLELLAWKPLDALALSASQLAAIHELFRRGDISWLLHPEQKKLLDWVDSKRRELAVVCISRQFGKTTMMLAYCIAFCLANARKSVLFVAPHKAHLDNYIMPKLNIVFSFLPDDLIPTRSGGIWRFPNGAVFRTDGMNVGRGTRVRGDTVDLCVMDEVREMNELQNMVESHISPMFTTTDGRLIMISTPPESPLHAFTDFYIRESVKTDDFYTATYKQNPLLSTKRLRYLMNVQHKGGEDNAIFRREYMADYSVADPDKRVIREWDEEANDLFFNRYAGIGNRKCRPYISMDYGFSDPCGIIAGYYDTHEGCLIITDEFFKRGMNTDDVGAQLTKMESELKTQLPGAVEPIRVMDIDPQLMGDLFTRFSLRFEPTFKVPNITAMLNRLRVGFVEGKIRIHPKCVQLRFQLQAGVFDAKGTHYLRTSRGGHLDLLDALKYLNLNMRWTEVLDAQMTVEQKGLKQGQFYVGPINRGGTFRSGLSQRPV